MTQARKASINHMEPVAGGPDISFWEWLFGGAVALGGIVGGFLYRDLREKIKDQGNSMENIRAGHVKVADQDRRDNTEQRRLIWERITADGRSAAEARLQDARVFATKTDIADLRTFLDQRMDRHERTMERLINNRPPVREQS